MSSFKPSRCQGGRRAARDACLGYGWAFSPQAGPSRTRTGTTPVGRRRTWLLLAITFALPLAGCASRTVRQGAEALETLATPDPAVAAAQARPAALARVDVLGEDL